MHIRKENHTAREGFSTGDLYRIMQNAAGAHCEEIGLGAAVTGPKNLIWVVVRQLTEMTRWPKTGEEFELLTWPGDTRHMFYPRYTLLKDAAGETLGRSCALWTLVDRTSRKMIKPPDYGVVLKGLVTGWEAPTPTAPRMLPAEQSAGFTVTPEVLDSNGHMNNTRYYDLAERVMGVAAQGRTLLRAVTEYTSEAREGERIALAWGQGGDRYTICGTAEEKKTVFRMELVYTPPAE